MSNMMRALVKAKAEPGIWMEEVPVPEIGPNDVLIKVKKTAICGTDVHIYNWDQWAQKTVPVPMVTGHEFVGTVADFGAAVTEYKVGQRVSGTYLARPFAGMLLGVQLMPDMRHFQVTVKFDKPVNVSKFESMVHMRQRVTATVGTDGVSPAHTSDGEPHMRLRRA